MKQQELIDEVMVRPRSAFIEYPGVECVDRPGWHQLTTPALKNGGLNGVNLAVLDSEGIQSRISETIAAYEGLGLRFRWTVGPDSEPKELGELLEARGLVPVAVSGMAASYARVDPDPTVQVELVTEETLPEYNALMAQGWGETSPFLNAYNLQALRDPRTQNNLFIARIGEQGVGGAGYFRFEQSAHLMGGVVLEKFRHRGAYRAMVRARQEHAHRAGVDLATSHAMAETSAPVLEKLGFTTVCRFISYCNT